MNRPTRPSVIFRGLSLLTVGLTACEKKPEFAFIEPLSTALWARPLCEGLHIKVADDGSGDLLLMSPSTSADTRQGLGLPAMKNLLIYRYSVKSEELHVVSPEVWNESGGSIVIYDKLPRLRNRGELTHDLDTRLLEFRGSKVETAGRTVLSTAISLNEAYVAVLSAEGKWRQGGLMPFGDPVISGKRFHQVFRMSDATPLGEPVILEGTTERNDVRPCWSPDGRYVVYKDGKCEHLWIIEAPGTSSEEESK